MGSSAVGIDRVLPAGVDRVAAGLVLAAFALLYGPTYWDLAHTVWPSDEQGHGPIILAVSFWLIFRGREELASLPAKPATALGKRCARGGMVRGALATRHFRPRCGGLA